MSREYKKANRPGKPRIVLEQVIQSQSGMDILGAPAFLGDFEFRRRED
jgi:hypothetical protein